MDFFLVIWMFIFTFGEHGSSIHGVKLYGKESSPITLQCKNITEGEFVTVVWLTNAYSKSKYTAFSYEAGKNKGVTHSHFFNRIQRVNGTSIRISKPRLGDSGNWECNIIYLYYPKDNTEERRRRVKVLASYDVEVVSPPVIRRLYPHTVAAPEFFRKSAVCEAYSTNHFTLRWVKINDNFTKYVNIDNIESFVNTEYRWMSHIFFDNLTTADAGRYLCVAKNIAGQVSREVDVFIQAKPKIFSKITRYKANINEDGEIKCVAIGYPRVSFTWIFTHNYEQIQLKSEETKGKFSTSRTTFTFYNGKELSISVLKIKKVNVEMWGTYQCIAENSIGYAKARIQLSGYGLPDPPAMLHTNEIEPNRITLYWLLDKSNGKIKSVVIERRQSGAKKWDGVEIHKPITKYTYVDLKDNSYYEFRLRSRNAVGLSAYSEIKKIKTDKVIVSENQQKAQPEKGSKKIFLNLNLISLTAICGGILLLLTCLFAGICFVMQHRRYEKRKKRKNESKNLIPLNRQNSQQCQTL